MFGKKQQAPVLDMEKLLPKLRAYAKEQYKPKPKPEPRPKISYSLSQDDGDQIRFSRAPVFYDQTETRNTPVYPEDIRKDPSLLDSPAMKRYYHSWEKKASVTKTFSSEVMRLVNKNYIKMSSFYRPAGIDKRTFNKIKNDYLYKPSRSTAMKCCLGLRLNREEAEELMRLAGYSFSPSDPSDLVVMFCIEKEIWDITSVNYLMDSFDLKDLDGYTAE